MEIYTIHYVTILYIYIYIYYIYMYMYIYIYIYTYKIEPSIWVYNIPTMDLICGGDILKRIHQIPPFLLDLKHGSPWISASANAFIHTSLILGDRSMLHHRDWRTQGPNLILNGDSSRFITGAYLTYHWNVIWISWSTTWSRKSEASGLCSILASYIFFPIKPSLVSRGHKEKTRAKLREPTLSGCCFVPFSLFWILNWEPPKFHRASSESAAPRVLGP